MKTFKVTFYYEEGAVISVTADSHEGAEGFVQQWLSEEAGVALPTYIAQLQFHMGEDLKTVHRDYNVRDVSRVRGVSTEATKD